jgi:2-polyprenyl-3-methyl-5-hydroxy-6-metoxy-1,4-benzoquinol methylase
MLPDFSTRTDRDEWMDDLSLPDETLRRTTDAVAYVNRWTGGVKASIAGLTSLVPPGRSTLSILDVGTGNGAMPEAFVEWGQSRGMDIEVTGIDLIESAIETARNRARSPKLSYACRDLFEMEPDDPSDRYDIVHGSLMLHHFPEDRAAGALRQMQQLARIGVVIQDLHRHPLHWAGSHLLIPLLTEDAMARHDGPVSVLRGFTRDELEAIAEDAGLKHASVGWHPPFRWLLVGRK